MPLSIFRSLFRSVRLLGRYSNRGTEAKKIRELCKRAGSEHVERTSVAATKTFSKLNTAKSAEILARYKAGDRPVDIARDFGITEWTVQNVRKRAGVPTRPHGMNGVDIDRAADLYASGLSLRKIAIRLGFSAKTITKGASPPRHRAVMARGHLCARS